MYLANTFRSGAEGLAHSHRAAHCPSSLPMIPPPICHLPSRALPTCYCASY
jgi:hypothetical protein